MLEASITAVAFGGVNALEAFSAATTVPHSATARANSAGGIVGHTGVYPLDNDADLPLAKLYRM
jgi:hypothetical protein